ncbi:DUF3320 domain-containing protein [Modestobacter sp. KNN46-3]|jgi:very-short-patch-repair endonuclease|uniref:DUF3320 domain-containing protein n=1 Tax=Modestobacter sp. KNN46-3 TaxID=2711218 RepID=UPI0013DED4EF|nr:DUF3320 domain-containing protein [Modestobacter sp. KNN46-3]
MTSGRQSTLSSDAETKLTRQFEAWKRALVAVDRRQRLVYFKHTKAASLEVDSSDLGSLWQELGAGAVIVRGTAVPGDESQRSSPRAGRAVLNVTNKSERDLPASLRRQDQVSQQTFADRGFWSLYLGIGFLSWVDVDDKPVESPLLLLPVRLSREGDASHWTLTATEDDVVLNPALQLVIEQRFGISLPPADIDSTDVGGYLGQIRAAVAEDPRMGVQERAVLATFSFHKEAIYRDLQENEQAVLTDPMVQVLALGPDAPSGSDYDFDPSSYDDVDRVLPPERMMSILDADSTQRRCIIAARDGKSFVMDGPPGTGKSQTIANIIAELMSAGRSVLFVSEKAAALDVVRNRLTAQKLDPFLLELHSHAATRKQVAAQLHTALTRRSRVSSGFSSAQETALVADRRSLSAFADAMNEVREGIGQSLFDVLGRAAQLSGYSGIAVPYRDEWLDLREHELAEIRDRAARLSRVWAPVVQGADFVWRGLEVPPGKRIEPDDLHRRADQARGAASALAGLVEAIDAEIGRSFPTSDDGLRRRLALLTAAEQRPVEAPVEWLSVDAGAFAAKHSRLAARRESIDALRAAESELERIAGARHAQLDSEMVSQMAGLDDTDRFGWAIASTARASEVASLTAWLTALPARLVSIDQQARRLGVDLGFGGDGPSLEEGHRLAELAVLGASAARPLGEWFNPHLQAALTESEQVLRTLVHSVRGRRAALDQVFTPAALDLDLRALHHRFQHVHTGLGRFSGQARADRKALKAVTLSGKANAAVLAHLDEAAEWQHAERELARGEQDRAAQLGSYYRHVDTDFDRVSMAMEVARRAVQIAGRDLDVPALANQLGAEGHPDPLLSTIGAELRDTIAQLWAEVHQKFGDHTGHLTNLPVVELATWAADLANALVPVRTASEHVAVVAGRDVTLSDARHVLLKAADRDARTAEILDAFDADRCELGDAYTGMDTDWESVAAALEWAGQIRGLLGKPAEPVVAQALCSATITAADLDTRLRGWGESRPRMLDVFTPERREELTADLASNLREAVNLLEEMSSESGTQIPTYVEYVRQKAWFGGRLASVLDEVIDQVRPAEEVASLLERAVLLAWIDAVVRADDRLERQRPEDREALVEHFRELDTRLVEHRFADVIDACNSLRPASLHSPAAAVIQREAQKKSRHKPIRTLIGETAGLLQQLKPCFMMSPLAVSQYLPSDMRFDVVIFDEASQVLPWDAINCVYRGRALIVAGDQRQLPPTNFFGATDDDAGDDDESSPDSFDSVLDLAKAAGSIPSLGLDWHYRSQHESLITYSNHRVYEGRLHTFPGATFAADDLGIESFVVDGKYQRGTTRDNPIEAESVVDRVVHHLEHCPAQSLGVVTFSAAQEDAVLAALERRATVKPALNALLTRTDRLDGFFVKSLENVQGDERDLIIFSIGYGPDEDGKFTMNFGPLNKKQGWRRLNVAITRARRRVEVVSSFRAGQITTNEFPGPDPDQGGIPHLKAYLDYAARGRVALVAGPVDAEAAPESPFEADVLDVVRAMGYQVEPQVGSAGYRIDLAVRHPERPGEYLIGIECDGAQYHSAKSARDRDRLRQQVLEGLGWRMYRIWGLTWVRDRNGSVRRLQQAIESALTGRPITAAPLRETPSATEVVEEEVDFDAPPSWAVSLPATAGYGRRSAEQSYYVPGAVESRPALRAYVERVLRAEAPMHRDRLLELLRNDWGIGRVGSQIQANVDWVLSKVTVDGLRVIRDGQDFLSLSGQQVTAVRVPADDDAVRKIGQVPPAELDLAVLLLVRDARSMTSDGVLNAVRNLYRWRRAGADIQAAISASVSRLTDNGKLIADGEELCVAEGVAVDLPQAETSPFRPFTRRQGSHDGNSNTRPATRTRAPVQSGPHSDHGLTLLPGLPGSRGISFPSWSKMEERLRQFVRAVCLDQPTIQRATPEMGCDFFITVEVALVPEPDNSHDSRAVSVAAPPTHGGSVAERHMGYLYEEYLSSLSHVVRKLTDELGLEVGCRGYIALHELELDDLYSSEFLSPEEESSIGYAVGDTLLWLAQGEELDQELRSVGWQ